jgi:hypothetical protein
VNLRHLHAVRFRRQRRSSATTAVLVAALTLTWPTVSLAQAIDFYFPQGTYGYDQQLGVTVQTRAHPLYAPLGFQVGGFNVYPSADQALFYNSNVNGVEGSGSWGSNTVASVSAGSNWTRNSLGMLFGVDHFQFLSLPTESYTNWNVGVAGGYTIADSQALLAYSHQSSYQLSTTLGTVRSTTPILNQTDSAGLEYTFNFGRISIAPDAGVGAYRFGSATSGGVTFNQNFLDYNSLGVGATARYALNEQSGLLVVVRGLNFSYVSPQAGSPSNDSNTAIVLGGVEYQAEGVWRYRVLAGLEVRKFATSQYPTRTAPDVEGSVIWSPTGLTTVDLTFSSTIEAPQTAGTDSYVLTQGRLVVDHELMRNVFLKGSGSVQRAQFSPGGTQTQFSGGAGITWLLNRVVHLSLGYSFTTATNDTGSTATSNPEMQRVGQYTQNLVAVTVHLAL